MMDPKPTFPEMFHPGFLSRSRDYKSSAKFHTRTARPTKYLFIDFGLSVKFEPGQDHKAHPLRGGDKTAPEFIRIERKDEYDPFPTDVYYLGNLIREDILRKTKGLEFIIPLVADMVQDEPTKRPTMDQVVSRYDKMMRSLSYFRLRSRLVERNEGPCQLTPQRLQCDLNTIKFGPVLSSIKSSLKPTESLSLSTLCLIPTPPRPLEAYYIDESSDFATKGVVEEHEALGTSNSDEESAAG
ncbi:hypothetical protein NLI96_g8118 [Meripilus lineatus]|uniref:Protein kinase domain-containing protein n=1 Tax=Meripilus lineatus TaxID=2056292 RepID=A0AAD5UXW9_9APHY|nr:hypothetical protein NLI96_g8118 [Physisporinus lineatus]